MPAPPAPQPARRLTLSQILELVLNRDRSAHSSVTLTAGARGETHIEVQVRTTDSDELATVEAAEAKAREVYDRLRAVYVTPAGSESATVSLTRNAKGDTQIDVQVRTADAGDVQTVEAAEAKARDSFERLRGKYPLAGGMAGKEANAS